MCRAASCERLLCGRAVHFDIAYNADRIIEIDVSTDPSQTVDISEDVVKVWLSTALCC